MFLRTFEHKLKISETETITIRLRELSFEDYFEFSATGKDMIDAGTATPKDWIHRQLELIARAMIDPAPRPVVDGEPVPTWTAEDVGKQFGKRLADDIYRKILKESGLDEPKDRPQVGEDTAVVDISLKKSAVA